MLFTYIVTLYHTRYNEATRDVVIVSLIMGNVLQAAHTLSVACPEIEGGRC